MSRLVLVCGPVGVGKTTHAIAQASELPAVRFSIDPWMQTLFAADMTALDYDWMVTRVARCHEQIWSVAAQILALDGNVVLDLGFTERAQRDRFVRLAEGIGVTAELHYLDAPKELRWQRVAQRNRDQDPDLYAFDVSRFMFGFMEERFEAPDADELVHGRTVDRS